MHRFYLGRESNGGAESPLGSCNKTVLCQQVAMTTPSSHNISLCVPPSSGLTWHGCVFLSVCRVVCHQRPQIKLGSSVPDLCSCDWKLTSIFLLIEVHVLLRLLKPLKTCSISELHFIFIESVLPAVAVPQFRLWFTVDIHLFYGHVAVAGAGKARPGSCNQACGEPDNRCNFC